MDRRTQLRKRLALAQNTRKALANRDLRIYPCGCREEILTAQSERRRNPWARGFRKARAGRGRCGG